MRNCLHPYFVQLRFKLKKSGSVIVDVVGDATMTTGEVSLNNFEQFWIALIYLFQCRRYTVHRFLLFYSQYEFFQSFVLILKSVLENRADSLLWCFVVVLNWGRGYGRGFVIMIRFNLVLLFSSIFKYALVFYTSYCCY